jgi:regulator of cell morphogenesis and NO signaling
MNIATGTGPINNSQPGYWAKQELPAVIEHILQRYHEPLRRELPVLIASARAVEADHQAHPTCPHGLTAHLEQVQLSVESHLQKEERILFPLILGGRGANAHMPIKVMMDEHHDHLANIKRTIELTQGFSLPSDASQAWRDLYGALRRLERDLCDHIALENEILFPRVLADDTGAY